MPMSVHNSYARMSSEVCFPFKHEVLQKKSLRLPGYQRIQFPTKENTEIKSEMKIQTTCLWIIMANLVRLQIWVNDVLYLEKLLIQLNFRNLKVILGLLFCCLI